ncbi:MAG TPA: Ku protein [Pirellulales bacterium]|jgi:DNA end-binding protein Ku|nr:Ku protein [Pirellulales bacterium]
MPPRSSWKGHLRFSLVSLPVQAFNSAGSDEGEVRFHQLHAECHSRIRYQKVCPIHGEVSNDEIVMGYEYAKGQYVIVDDDEVDKLRGTGERAIDIEAVVKPEDIDPLYFEGRTYYLLPDGPMATKTYAVLLEALKARNGWAVGQAVMFGREHLVVLRPIEKILCLELLHYAGAVRKPEAVLENLSLPPVSKEELRLATKLIEASTRKRFDIERYKDTYNTKMRELIAAKVEGKEIVGPPEREEPPVINLMDALRQSLERVQEPKKASAPRAKPTKRKRSGRRTA